jgi:putative endonuclease
MSRQYYVYLMTNRDNRVLYVGVTNNLLRRIGEHRDKLIPGFTAKYNVKKLAYFECHGDVRFAIAREKQMKSWSRKRKNELVDTMNPKWEDLFDRIG